MHLLEVLNVFLISFVQTYGKVAFKTIKIWNTITIILLLFHLRSAPLHFHSKFLFFFHPFLTDAYPYFLTDHTFNVQLRHTIAPACPIEFVFELKIQTYLGGGGALGACVPTVIPRPSTPAIFCRYGKEKRSKNRQSTNLYYCTPPSCSTFHRPWCHSDAYLFNKHYLHIIGMYLLLSCRLLGKFQMICDISSKFCGLLRKPEL